MRRQCLLMILLAALLAGCAEGQKPNPLPGAADVPAEPAPRQPAPPTAP